MILPPESFWKAFKETPGALSVSEAIAIIQIAALAPEGTYLEVGSHKGKSSAAAAFSLKKGTFHLVEPEFEDKWWALGVKALVEGVNKDLSVTLIADYSTNVMDKLGPYSYFFWDSGIHAGEILQKETELIEDTMIPGGILCSHDVGNQFTQQTEAMNYLASTGKYEWVDIKWQEIFDYVKEHDLEANNNSWHTYPELPHPPNFVAALRRK